MKGLFIAFGIACALLGYGFGFLHGTVENREDVKVLSQAGFHCVNQLERCRQRCP